MQKLIVHHEVDELTAALLQQRQEQLQQATNPLPGSVPYDNFRPINVPGRFASSTFIDFLTERFPNTSREDWLELIAAGRIVARSPDTLGSLRHAEPQQHVKTVSPEQLVREGDRFDHVTPQYVEPDVNADIRILYEDALIVVVNKPAPLPMHACGRFERNTLQSILDSVYAPQRLRAAHRLDAATSGVVLHSRSRDVARRVQPQFEQRRVDKLYVAKVVSHPANDDFVCTEPIAATTQRGGLRNTDQNGLPAETRFCVLRRNADGTALIEARPVTGRTNQIRIHLWSLGLPICGDSYYLPEHRLGSNDVPDVQTEPLCLHARSLTFEHPETDKPVTFEAPMPRWADR
ncbi:MAG: RluA family pseudouridine synthase [Planctomycetota bacterium]|jgi:RluA family pseudouridine synthase